VFVEVRISRATLLVDAEHFVICGAGLIRLSEFLRLMPRLSACWRGWACGRVGGGEVAPQSEGFLVGGHAAVVLVVALITWILQELKYRARCSPRKSAHFLVVSYGAALH
jgi:hypothetical protein